MLTPIELRDDLLVECQRRGPSRTSLIKAIYETYDLFDMAAPFADNQTVIRISEEDLKEFVDRVCAAFSGLIAVMTEIKDDPQALDYEFPVAQHLGKVLHYVKTVLELCMHHYICLLTGRPAGHA
jgi:hypothetical protein